MSDKQHLPEITTRPITLTVSVDTEFTVEHDLGRIPAGWLIIDCNNAVDVWRSGAMDREKIELTASNDAEITLVLL